MPVTSMLDYDTARAIAARYVADRASAGNYDLVLADSYTERPTLFAFFFGLRDYIEHGDRDAILVGEGPLLVDRLTGQVHLAGTAHPIEHYIAEHERRQNKSH